MAMSLLSRLAAGAAAPVFPVIGAGVLPQVERLFSSPTLRRVGSPREAAILLVAGEIPESAREALDRVHDQVPHPRTTETWDGASPVEDRLTEAWRALCAGGETEPDRRPDTPPNEWKGKGDHGHGGEGMMGGVPYGRPMAMPGEDVRDGLQLDRYSARVGPFAPMLPPGLVLEVVLQGDVIVDLSVCAAPFPQPDEADAPELCAARMVRLLGLDAAAARLVQGPRPAAVFIRTAVPSGLGALPGSGDARERLSGWLAGKHGPNRVDGLADALVGLEWHEMTLVLASLPPSTLAGSLSMTEAA
ncbi:hypothetical protein LVO79_21205 (plasmid) [Roseivivax marinus]|uniref:hypothetical protein n=1 Tax=Roseivivax marinus TaxID=1379903 RepID=UPI001F035C23|nr:hypothetical protein [Roseivivax marinus]UMA67374.1 hypothetical protein LVO79_21205 [Roseivivax marinus]